MDCSGNSSCQAYHSTSLALHQLAADEGHQYPAAAKVLKNDFYVDDMLTGTHTLEDARQLRSDIIALMTKGQLNLRKWTSNSKALMADIPEHLREKDTNRVEAPQTLTDLPQADPHPQRRSLGNRLRQLLVDIQDDEELENNSTEWNRSNNLPKLPPVQLMKFSGNDEDWQSFIELFTSVIHNNPSLSGVQKMQYLAAQLEGQPKRLIARLTLTNSNYESALSILKERYENKRHMVMSYMNSIVHYKRLSSGSAEDVIKLHDCINACLEGLKNLGYNVTSWDPMIVAIAMMKFDTETNQSFEESIDDINSVPTVKELLKFLLKRFRVLRTTSKDSQHSKENKKKSFHVTATHSISCSKCNKNHPLIKCFSFKKLDPQERKQHAVNNNLCFNCLSHDKNEKCQSTKSCFKCNKKHHTLLHLEQKRNSDKKETSKATYSKDSKEAKSEEQVKSNDGAVAFHVNTSSVVLPTAQVKIQDRHGIWQTFRALLDTGSGDTFISEDAAQMLKLPRQKVITSIKGIGEVNAGVCKSTVDITIASRIQSTQKWHTTALILPKLSSFLPTKPISSSFSLHLTEKIVLADPKFNIPGSIDLIIGTNIYAQIVKTNLKRDQNGLIAQDTELGWIILGSTVNPRPPRK
uniref:Uncharacterized protein n=1 Tax=Phlebotomus papatasi TaxID=29031 RepID=A0A1B0D820_PHLPP